MRKPKRQDIIDPDRITYIGLGHGDQVFIDYDGQRERERLDPRLDVMAISREGFVWGSKTALATAQLALAVLLHALDSETRALLLYQRFKWRIFVPMTPGQTWTMSRAEVLKTVGEIEETAREQKKHQRPVPEVAPINDRDLNVGLGGGKLVFEGDER